MKNHINIVTTYLKVDYFPKYFLFFIFICYVFQGCYSFTGGSVPEHLKTIYITAVADNSGYGNPIYKDNMTQSLVNRFRDDNSFKIAESAGDARLSVTIKSIKDDLLSVGAGRQGTLENERKITVDCSVEYYDAVKKKNIWSKTFSNYRIYELANAQQARDEAVQLTLDQISDDIFLAVVSGW